MSSGLSGHPRLERMLAALLRYGTWLACAIMALGLGLAWINGATGPHQPDLKLVLALSGTQVITAGIALLILLPVFRVALMLIVFVLERDYRYAAIAAFVLAIIFLGFILGTAGSPA
jgi:uncharacterized membrane protein